MHCFSGDFVSGVRNGIMIHEYIYIGGLPRAVRNVYILSSHRPSLRMVTSRDFMEGTQRIVLSAEPSMIVFQTTEGFLIDQRGIS